jgi:hypothetical protein
VFREERESWCPLHPRSRLRDTAGLAAVSDVSVRERPTKPRNLLSYPTTDTTQTRGGLPLGPPRRVRRRVERGA